MSEKEFQQIIELHSDDLLRYLTKCLGDNDTAKDILQDTFLTFWSHKQDIEIPKSKSWLFTTAHNNMLKAIRHKKVRDNTPIPTDNTSKQNLESEQLVDYLLKQLNDRMRQCLMLKDWQGFSIKEIAEILDISEENVKVNIFRAKVKLKELKSQL